MRRPIRTALASATCWSCDIPLRSVESVCKAGARMAKHPAVVQLMRQSNCTASLQVNAVAESIADREVHRLRSAPDWRGAAVLPMSRDPSEGGW